MQLEKEKKEKRERERCRALAQRIAEEANPTSAALQGHLLSQQGRRGGSRLLCDALRQCTAALGLSFGFFFLIHSDLRSYGTFLS